MIRGMGVTREQLEAVGYDDAKLADLVKEVLGVEVSFAGPDTPELQDRREAWWRQAMVRATNGPDRTVHLGNEPIGAYDRRTMP